MEPQFFVLEFQGGDEFRPPQCHCTAHKHTQKRCRCANLMDGITKFSAYLTESILNRNFPIQAVQMSMYLRIRSTLRGKCEQYYV